MSDRKLHATVPQSLEGVRVDRAISMLTGVSRSQAATLVREGRVRVDGRTARSRSTTLAAGAELAVDLDDEHVPGLIADPHVRFDVVYEDEDLVVVDKPPGVVVHPGAGQRTGTLVAGLLARFPDIAGLSGTCDAGRPGIVHRLDRGTSGLLVVARTQVAYQSLARQMAARSVGRRYLALVAGHLEDDRGLIDAPIGRSARNATKMAISASGRPARTGYEVVRRLERLDPRAGELLATLVECRLETGRTHQIRVHFAAIGHPVIGDDRYGSKTSVGLLSSGRLFLHAAELSFDHPVTGARLAWSSPLPPDLESVVSGGGLVGSDERPVG